MAIDLLVKNANIPNGDSTILVDILIEKGKIVGRISGVQIDAREIIDAEGNLVIPGCFDSHTHFNDPGFTHRENFLTGSSAAASGGITMIMDMPCCSVPSVRSVEDLQFKLEEIEEKAIVDYAMWGGITGEDIRNNRLDIVQSQAEQGVCAFKVYMTPSVPTYSAVTDPEMLEVFRLVGETGLPVGIHAENYAICNFYMNNFRNNDRFDGPAWAESRLSLAEKVAIEMVISFAEYTKTRVHIVHMSTGAGAVMVGQAKMNGLDVTAETCPHYLTLNYQEAMTRYHSFAKIAPPLRTKADNEILWNAVMDGRVDFIATDHAPYEIATEKTAEGMDIWNSFPGIPGVETMVPVMVSEGYNKGRISLSRLVEILSKNSAIHYGLYPKKGSLEIGSDADLTIIDLNRIWTIDQTKMFTMAKYTPFHGMKLRGKPVKTVVRGKLVYDETKGIVGRPGFGQFVRRQTVSKLENKLRF